LELGPDSTSTSLSPSPYPFPSHLAKCLNPSLLFDELIGIKNGSEDSEAFVAMGDGPSLSEFSESESPVWREWWEVNQD
jgi:hypothetical protein